MREGVRGVGSGEAGGASPVQVASKSFQAIENVRPREISRKEVRDFVNHDVEACLDGVSSVDQRNGVAELAAVDVRETRAEEIAPDNKIGDATFADGSLGIAAVGLAGLVVPGVAGAGNVHDAGGDRGSERAAQSIRGDIGSPGVFQAVLWPAVFKTVADETLRVVPDTEQLVSPYAPIHFTQVDVLILSAGPGAGTGLQIGERGLLIRGRISGRRDRKEDQIG